MSATASASSAALLALVLGVAGAPAEPVVVLLPGAGGPREAALRAALDAVPGSALQSAAVTQKAVAAARALGAPADCAAGDAACAVRLGALCGAAWVVVVDGAPGAAGERLVLFDVSELRERAAVPVPTGADLKLAALQLLAPQKARGALAVVVKPAQMAPGSVVVVDGVARGVLPLPGPIDVAPGLHDVSVGKAGLASVQKRVNVAAGGAPARVELDLAEGPFALPPAPTVLVTAAPTAAPPSAPAAAPLEPAAAPGVVEKRASARKFTRLAVYEVSAGEGLEPNVARITTEALLAELRKLDGASVIGMDEIRAMLDHEANKQLAGCEADTSCLAEIASALGADDVIIGTLARVGDQSVFGLRRLEQSTGQAKAQVAEQLVPAGGEEFVAAVGPAVEKLFPELPLRPGQTRGAAPEMARRLNPPPVPAWAFYTSAGAVGAVAAGAAAVGAINAFAHDSYRTQALPAGGGPADGRVLKETENLAEASAWTFWGLLGATVLGGVAVGVEAFFVDWWGYSEAS